MRFEQNGRFCEVRREGVQIHIRTGKLGDDGRTSIREYDSDEEAERELAAYAAQRREQGWREITVVVDRGDARDPDLERAIAERPDDVARWLVYGDWLQQQGDPQGELISVQQALEGLRDPTRFAQLKRREQDLLRAIGPRLLQPLGKILVEGRTRWRRGFLKTVTIEPRGAEAVKTLFSARVAQFVDWLGLRTEMIRPRSDAPEMLRATLDALATARPPLLAELSIEAGGLGSIGDLSPLCASLPRLERLQIDGDDFELRGAERLSGMWLAGGVAQARVDRIARAAPQLSHVQLAARGGRVAGIEALVASLPSLRSLEVWGMANGDEVAEAIATARPARLERLVLTESNIGARGAEAIARRKLPDLVYLDLRRNRIPGPALAALSALCEKVLLDAHGPRGDGDDDEEEDEDRYDEVEE